MKNLKRKLLAVVLLVVMCGAANAETGINAVVHVIESRYAVHAHGIPGLWLAKPFLLGAGVGGFKMVQFEKFCAPVGDAYVLKTEFGKALGENWSPFIETWSKSDKEWTTIYANTAPGATKMLIVSCDQGDGLTVMQMNLNGKRLGRWIDEPVDSATHDPLVKGNKE